MNIIKFSYYFFKGLKRNFKIIRYGEVPEIYQIPKYLEIYGFADRSVKGYFLSVKELGRHLLRPVQKIYQMPDNGVVFCGPTANNEREFVFLSDLLNGQVPTFEYSRDYNLSFIPSGERRKGKREKIISAIIFIFCCAYLFRVKLGPISLKYLIVYGKIFSQLFSSIQRHGLNSRLAVVANDHTDFPVVTSMVMQYFEVPVIYVQHAEISENFPPLDFDISILRNRKSLQKYEKIGSVRGESFIIPRREKGENFERIFHLRDSDTPVVIYLSSVFDTDRVKRCIESLQANPGVLSVGIKPHPRSKLDAFENIPGTELYDKAPSFDHVAIVPNSSVVVELLEDGIPVFQLFDLDDVGEDYYGFVVDGVACRVSEQALRDKFWSTDFYNHDWLSRFEEYSAAVDDSWRDAIPVLASRVESYL